MLCGYYGQSYTKQKIQRKFIDMRTVIDFSVYRIWLATYFEDGTGSIGMVNRICI